MRIVLSTLVCCFVLAWSTRDVLAQPLSPIHVTRLYTGSDGQTHAEQIEVKLAPSGMLDGTGRADDKVSNMRFVRWPPEHVNDWHTPPGGRQYVITLSGRGEVELIDGQKIALEPGRVILAEDLTGKGHLTRSVGSEDWVSLHVYIADR
jgi:quercetin dioxygenase-like cupin family protein